MSQLFSLERIALALFAAALTLITATVVFAREMRSDDNGMQGASKPVDQNMTCRAAHDQNGQVFNVKFVNYLRDNFVSEGASVTSEMLGTCGANAPETNIKAFGGAIVVHSFVAGGHLCNEVDGSVTFSLFHDRTIGQSRIATLKVKDVVYNCKL